MYLKKKTNTEQTKAGLRHRECMCLRFALCIMCE